MCAECGLVQEEPPLIKVVFIKFEVVVWAISLVVIELKVLWDVLCDSYYDVMVNYKIVLFEEMQWYKPPTACWIVLGRILGRSCCNAFGRLYSLERLG